VEKNSINSLKMIRYSAMMAAWVGDKDLACEQLAIVVHSPDDLSHGNLKTSHALGSTASDPRSSNSKL
jgi:hypothetical protein